MTTPELHAVGLDTHLEDTRALCPECLAECPAAYYQVGNEIELRRVCEDHGLSRSMFWSDAAHFAKVQAIDAKMIGDGTGACCAPGTAGCGGDITSRRCVTVLPITDGCNLSCSYCFAASGPGQEHRSIERIDEILQGVIETNNGPTPLQLSGGEPTIHPDLIQIIERAKAHGFDHIEINSNGIRLGQEPEFAKRLKQAGANAVYLQFDGLTDKEHHETRDAKVTDHRRNAIEHCRNAKLPVILVPTIVKGRNDHALGDIIRFALDNHDIVQGINIQPVRHFGRFKEDTGHLSQPDIANLIAEQVPQLKPTDLAPIPCCSAACYAATVLLPLPGGRIVPVNRYIQDDKLYDALQYVGERRFMDVLAGTENREQVIEDIACACDIPLPKFAKSLMERTVLVSVTGFMDAETADTDRMKRCCVNVATADGTLAPFCGYYLTDRDGNYAWRDEHHPGAAR